LPGANWIVKIEDLYFMPRPLNQILTDEQLLLEISKGNGDAFDQIFRVHFKSIALYLYTFLHDTATAEDIAQETFIKLWKVRATLQGVKNLKAYLYRIAHNECLTWLSKKQNKPLASLETAGEFRAIDSDIHKNIIIAETIRELHKMIASLSPKVKQVFQLYYLEGRSTEEISKLLKVSIKTVMNQRKAALKAIRQRFYPG
jgi:RNA polymerase sigma-70 factor (ECF subfamily)